MRTPAGLALAALLLAACASTVPRPAASAPAPRPASPPEATSPPTAERLAADTPSTTATGNTFVAPAGWSLSRRNGAVVLEAPEGGSFLAIVDVPVADAATADAALARAWSAYRPGDATRPVKVAAPVADRDGWTQRTSYEYLTSPNERRGVAADVRRASDVWTVAIYDMADDVGEKRGAQVALVLGKLLPRGRTRESFAGRKANVLDAARIAELTGFVETSMKLTGVPGVSLGILQDGKVVFAGGFGVRELGKPARPDADTRFMIASNTKAMATLMLAKLVDAGKLRWDTPATSALPSFRLGDPETTSRVRIEHLVCACTGMPRQDLEWLLQFDGVTPEKAMKVLATMKPTSGFGELFQYSNPLAAAAGFIGGHVMYPKLELGAAYDKAVQTLVFDPLGMRSTTHDFARAMKGNFAMPHAPDVDGKTALAEGRINRSIVPLRPAGGAWSTVNDLLRYVAMELGEGKLPDGTTYISREALLARREPHVVVATDVAYGMGLMVNQQYGVTVVQHGGDLIGFHSDMLWLPEHGVGAVILTNGDPGWIVRSAFGRRLLEVLFDGEPEAEGRVAAGAKAFFAELAAERKLLAVPADPAQVKKLAPRYAHPALGEVAVVRAGGRTRFDFGEFSSEVASRVNPDGTVSFVTIAPGFEGLEFVVGDRTLTLRDAQHEYVLAAR